MSTVYNDEKVKQPDVTEVAIELPATVEIVGVRVIKKEFTVPIPHIVYKDQEYERPVIVDKETIRYVAKDEETTKYVSREELTTRYIVEEQKTVKYVPVIQEIPDIAAMNADIVQLRNDLRGILDEVREGFRQLVKTINANIPTEIKVPKIVTDEVLVSVPKFVEVEVANVTVKEEVVDVIKPNFILRDYEVTGKITVRK